MINFQVVVGDALVFCLRSRTTDDKSPLRRLSICPYVFGVFQASTSVRLSHVRLHVFGCEWRRRAHTLGEYSVGNMLSAAFPAFISTYNLRFIALWPAADGWQIKAR